MSRLRAVLLCLSLGAMMSGCAYVAYEPVNLYPEATSDKALVYFYREPAFFGGGAGYPVGVGNEEIGALVHGSYFFEEFEPGEYTFWVRTDRQDQVTVKLAAGQTYYLSSHASLLGAYIEKSSVARGERAVRNLRYALKTDP